MSPLNVLAPGVLTTVQDLGRSGYRHLGVPLSGAADRASLRLANRLVGNPEQYAALEVTLGGFEAVATEDVLIALTGASVDATVAGRDIAMRWATLLGAGETIRLGVPRTGTRTYVAIAGGVATELVLGSRATDTLGGIGPPQVRRGTRIDIGPRHGYPPAVDAVPVEEPGEHIEVGILRGPRDDLFVRGSYERLCRSLYVATAAMSRVGVKLDGPPLEHLPDIELRSEAMLPGAIEVPGSGLPIVLLADAPTTGGYPVIGVVRERDLGAVSQLRPGATVSFFDDAGRR